MFSLLVGSAYSQQIISVFGSDDTELVDFTITPVKDKIYGSDWAEYQIDIINNKKGLRNLQMIFDEDGLTWSLLSEPSSYYTTGLQINSENPTSLNISIKPKIDFMRSNIRPMNVPLRFVDINTKEQFTVNLRLFLMEDPINGTPINISIGLPSNLDPKETHNLKVEVVNNRVTEIKDLKLIITSKYFNENTSVSLKPFQKKEVDFQLKFDPDLPQTKDTMTITGIDRNDILFQIKKDFNIVSKSVPYEQKSSHETKFLKRIKTITLTNDENIAEAQKIYIELDSFWFLTSASEKGLFEKENGQRYFIIPSLALDPHESYVLSLTTNYVPVAIVCVILIIILFLYFMFKSPIVIRKDAEPYEEQGGVTGIKVILTVKNLTKRRFKDLKIIDLAPKISTVAKENNMGTLSPSKVLPTDSGHVINWDIDELEPKEERIITYRLNSRLTLINGVRLPSAKIELKIDTHHVTIKSNEIDVVSSNKIKYAED